MTTVSTVTSRRRSIELVAQELEIENIKILYLKDLEWMIIDRTKLSIRELEIGLVTV